uniref:BAR domain-containing protein n=1 Tax=Globodera rostochiensis TaxID=31243 RepID=A0A914HGW9_GLORO
MDFNLKRLAGEASGMFNRAKQLTEEKLLHAEKTELDPHFEQLLAKADKTEEQSKKLLSAMEAYLQPNPALRMGDAFYEKLEIRLDTSPANRSNNLEYLGEAMQEAGQTFGIDTPFGGALQKVAQTEAKLGGAERELIQTTVGQTLMPIRRFLEGDMRNIQRERRVLQKKRLDLDAAKSRLKRARTLESQATRTEANLCFEQAEADLRVAQAEFDKQVEILRILLESLQTAQNQQLKNLFEFVEAQSQYFSTCQQHMADLKRELNSAGGGRSNGISGSDGI